MPVVNNDLFPGSDHIYVLEATGSGVRRHEASTGHRGGCLHNRVELCDHRAQPMSSPSSPVCPSPAPQEDILAAWVHVSDLHFGHGDARHQWNQKQVLDELLVDAGELVHAGVVARPHFVFVTGDVAFSGGARTPATGEAEYTLAADWLRQLQQALEVPDARVCMVPGNHDVDRHVDDDVRRLLKDVRAGEESLDDLLQKSREVERLRGRMARYLAFAEGFKAQARERFHGGLWWRERVELAEGVSLRICGLNTAVLSLDDQDRGRLRVGQRQLAELFTPAPGPLELTLVLGHHPATGRWLDDEKDLRGRLDRLAAIHLFGHIHDADSEQARYGWGAGGLRIAAGAAHAEAAAGDAPPDAHGYTFGALVVLPSGDLAVRLWPRRWSRKVPRFVTDVDNLPDGRDYAEHRLPERFRIHRAAPPPRMSVSLSKDKGVTGSAPQDGDLITIGPQIALFGRIAQDQENRWLVSIGDYVRGDAAGLARYISRFYHLHENLQVVTSNVVGSGREITKVPVWIDGRLGLDVELPPRRSFTTLALGEDSDLVAPMRTLAGADAMGQKLALGLRLALGEYAYSPYSGSIVQQLFAEAHPPTLLAGLVRAEVMRLCVHHVRSAVWIGDVMIIRQDAESVVFECEIDDKRDGVRSHRFTLKVAPQPSVDFLRLGAPPDVTALGSTEWMPRADRVLEALRECALFAPAGVRLTDMKAKIGAAAEDWDIRRALEHLIARKNLSGQFEVRDGEGWFRPATTWNL